LNVPKTSYFFRLTPDRILKRGKPVFNAARIVAGQELFRL
jgi:hypothetical protein